MVEELRQAERLTRKASDWLRHDKRHTPAELAALLDLFAIEMKKAAAALEACRAERERLGEALDEIAAWDSQSAARHGHRGVREYAKEVIAATPTSPEPREGMVMVYNSTGAYLGCMGIERWQRLLEEDAPASPAARESDA
jgi:hypothetical protein